MPNCTGHCAALRHAHAGRSRLIRGSHVRHAVPIGLHLIRKNRVQKTGIRFRADIRRRNTRYAQGCSLLFRERRTSSAPGASRIHFGSNNSNRDIGLHFKRIGNVHSYHHLLKHCKQLLFILPRNRCRNHQVVRNGDRSTSADGRPHKPETPYSSLGAEACKH